MMIKIIKVNPITGKCNNGTNLWDLDIEEIRTVLIWTRYLDVAKLAKEILEYKRSL